MIKASLRGLAAAGFAACLALAQVARAEPVEVFVAGMIDVAPYTSGPADFFVRFNLDSVIAAAHVQSGGEAFVLDDLPVEYGINGASSVATHTSIGWFAYASQNYFGIDIRLFDVLVPGNDQLQIVVPTAMSLFGGPANAPVLDLTLLSSLAGNATYYRFSPFSFNSGSFDNVIYSVTAAAVPVPSTYALAGLGLGLLGWTARRRHPGNA